ncbi:MAG: iron-sulfur cluster-binding protein [Betaproteobacteria bacterium]|nr:iron-sulfur cluster-binding protein [Betaproteobacteria bacterium]
MQITSQNFKAVAAAKLGDANLRKSMAGLRDRMVEGRAKAAAEVGNFEEMREAGKRVRDHALAHLDLYLETFERNAIAQGTKVHWAENSREMNELVLNIARQTKIRKVIKSKSMLGEESGLNRFLMDAGIEVRETDLGEYILEQSGDTPSHIIAPAVHKTREEVSDLFHEKHKLPRKTDIAEMTREARMVLRPHFLDAGMGITGANFLVADTGTTVIVTNEGNGRMTTTMPRVHVAIAGIEKVVPTLEDVSLLLRLLTRSATAQTISNYLSFATGPKRQADPDGPEEFHIVLVDAGRSRVLGSELREALRCIRCGACMNHCPVYQNIGGHPYGWVYPGPIGSVLTPAYAGLEKAIDLPNAATLCNQCGVVCPVKIPLPDLMRKLREQQVEKGLRPWQERLGLKLWTYAAMRPRLYALLTQFAARLGKWIGGETKLLHRLPGGAWTQDRDLPAPQGKTFRELYAGRKP